jgi:hypothetical protein
MNPRIASAVAAAVIAAASVVGSLKSPADDPRLTNYQARCAQALSYFIGQVPKVYPGYQVTFGEAWRPQWVAVEYAKRGMGISTSLHIQRLAVDLNLFINGVFQEDGSKHKPTAELWKAVAPAFGVEPAAGIDFGDGNHYSCAWRGVK